MTQLPRLPDFVRGSRANQASARQLNRAAREISQRQASVIGTGSLLPIQYGRVRTGGEIFVETTISGDLLLGVLWGSGPIQGVEVVYVNDEDLPGAVTATHYTGTDTQTADPTLASAISGYDDDLQGVAYSVFRIPPDLIGGWPRFQAIVEGKLLYDPRSDTTSYSENPALALADLITNESYGLGREVRGLTELADRCDELVDGTEARNRIGLEIDLPSNTYEWLDILSSYAECFWTFEDTAIRLIIDGPVESPSAHYGPKDIVQNTFSAEVTNIADSPTVVEIRYTDASGLVDAEPWGEQSAISEKEGVGDTVREIKSVVRMQGITRFSEAFRKAETRRLKAAQPGIYSWVTWDENVYQQKGDVVEIELPRLGIFSRLVRVTEVTMREPGRYIVTARDYSPSVYSDDVQQPTSTAEIPVGGIAVLREGESVPTGWEAWTKSNDLFIQGTDNPSEQGSYSAQNDSISYSRTSTARSNHSSSGGTFSALVRTGVGGSIQMIASGTTPLTAAGGHSHNYSFNYNNIKPQQQRVSFAVKTNEESSLLPPECAAYYTSFIFAYANAQVWPWQNGAYLTGGNSWQVINGTSGSSTVSSFAGGHSHYSLTQDGILSGTTKTGSSYRNTGGHQHSVVGSISVSLDAQNLLIQGATNAHPIVSGGILAFDNEIGDINNLPNGWKICDGSNGTVDMRNAFIRSSNTNTAGPRSGSNVANAGNFGLSSTLFGGGVPNSHNHQGTSYNVGGFQITRTVSHTLAETHTHGAGSVTSGSTSTSGYLPDRYRIVFIQFLPEQD